MGRKRKVAYDEFLDSIRRHSDCFLNDATSEIQPEGHEIWHKIAKDLDFKYQPVTIFLHLRHNRNDIMCTLGRRLVSNQQLLLDTNDISDSAVVDSTAGNDDGSNYDEPLNCDSDCVTFQFEIEGDDWVMMKPVAKLYKGECVLRSNKLILPKGIWTTIFEHHFCKATGICCPVTYDSGRVSMNGARYITIEGHCKVCKSTLSAGVVNQPMPEETCVMFEGRYSGSFKKCDTLTRPQKRRITPLLKQHFVQSLVEHRIPGSIVRDQFADLVMNFGDHEPPYVPCDSSLRCLKSKELKKQRIDNDPIMGVFALKYGRHQTSIFSIGYDKFFVHYWTAAEIVLYREYAKQNLDCVTLCIDATGSLIKKPKYYSFREFHELLYYEIVVNDKKSQTQFAVAHMFSERHDNNAISFWLEDWLRSKVPRPKQVVTDMSLALMSAVVKTFTPYDSLWAYIDACFNIIQNNGKNHLGVPCLIRNDVAHVMKIITSWKPFEKVDGRAKEFICSAMGQILLCESMDEVEDLLRNLFWVINSETCGMDCTTGEIVSAEIGIHFLRQKIATGIAHCDMAAFLENCGPEHGDPAYTDLFPTSVTNRHVVNCFYVSMSTLANRCRSDVEKEKGDHLNIFYLPSLIPMVLDLCAYLPLWSGIMCKIVGFGDIPPSSAPVESNFAVLKRRIFKNEDLPMRVDHFIALHLDALSGKSSLNYARLLRSGMFVRDPDASNLNSSENPNNAPDASNLNSSENPNNALVDSQSNVNCSESGHDPLLDVNHLLMMESDSFRNDGPASVNGDDDNVAVRFDANEDTAGCVRGIDSDIVGYSAHSSVEYEVVGTSANSNAEMDVVNISLESNVEHEEEVNSNSDDEGVVNNNSGRSDIFYHRTVTEPTNVSEVLFDSFDESVNTNNLTFEHIEVTTHCDQNKSYERDAVEGWNKKRPRQNRRSYLTNKAELLRANLKTQRKRKLIGLLRNGGNVVLRGVSMFSDKFTLTNTCGFDSITQIMAVAYCDSDIYAGVVEPMAQDNTFWELVQSLSVDGVTPASYIKRAKILYNMMHDKAIPQLYSVVIDATCNAEHLITWLFQSQESVAECGMCSNRIASKLIYSFIHAPIPLSRATSDWLTEKMTEPIFNWFAEIGRCSACDNTNNLQVRLMPHLIISAICFNHNDVFIGDVACNITVKLSNIPKFLDIQNTTYYLRGVITTPLDQNVKSFEQTGHYTACCYREPYKTWEIYDDLKTQGTRIRANTVVAVEVFIYTR